jgi:hypothetical protein
MRHVKSALVFVSVLAVGIVAAPRSALAQGCVLIRQNGPLLGQGMSPDLLPGEWEFSFSTRNSTADKHYRGDVEQVQRQTLGTYVLNKQHAYDFAIRYQATSRLGFSASIPLIDASWALPYPLSPKPGERVPQRGEGLGDLTIAGRYWLFDPHKHVRGNVAVGAGIKLPTGADDVTAFYPTLAGAWSEKAIDQSAQPGDGGLGLLLDSQGFWRFGKSMIYGTASYLANPKNTNGTPSILMGLLGPAANTPANANKLVNSVADQYLLRIGGATPIPKLRHFAASLAFRAEGLNRYDVFGRSDGFRRPGYELYLEPGLSYYHKGQSFSFNVPVGLYRMRKPDPYTGAEGDATFPDYVFLGSYSIRFGRGTSQLQRPPQKPPLPSPPVTNEDE